MANGESSDDGVWLFGYGSLIFKTDFDYRDAKPAAIEGWARRFWQGSRDHRGVPGAPGRVVTLIRAPGTTCHGMAYRVPRSAFAGLDHREKDGFERVAVAITLDAGATVQGLMYRATAHNAAFLGDAPLADMAAHINGAAGASGTNRDYALRLAESLRRLKAHDPHVFDIERALARLNGA